MYRRYADLKVGDILYKYTYSKYLTSPSIIEYKVEKVNPKTYRLKRNRKGAKEDSFLVKKNKDAINAKGLEIRNEKKEMRIKREMKVIEIHNICHDITINKKNIGHLDLKSLEALYETLVTNTKEVADKW